MLPESTSCPRPCFQKKKKENVQRPASSMLHSSESYFLCTSSETSLGPSLYSAVKKMPGDSVLSAPHPSNQNPLKSFWDFMIKYSHMCTWCCWISCLCSFTQMLTEQFPLKRFRKFTYFFGSAIITHLCIHVSQNCNINTQVEPRHCGTPAVISCSFKASEIYFFTG